MTALGEGIQSSWYRIRIRIGGLIGGFPESLYQDAETLLLFLEFLKSGCPFMRNLGDFYLAFIDQGSDHERPNDYCSKRAAWLVYTKAKQKHING